MAGHSHFKNIMFRKGAQDKKKSKLYAKLGRDIQIACREGGNDPETNSKLRMAIQNAKSNSLPKANIDRLLSQGNEDLNSIEEIIYEGFGPDGVAVIVETITDNRNRTASRVRSTFSKQGGNMGEPGCVGYLFEKIALLQYAANKLSEDEVLEAALESGADNFYAENGYYYITAQPNLLHEIIANLKPCLGDPDQSEIIYSPNLPLEVSEETRTKISSFINILEEIDEVQNIYTNMD